MQKNGPGKQNLVRQKGGRIRIRRTRRNVIIIFLIYNDIYLLYKNNISFYNDTYIFSHSNFCMILITFKKVDENALNPRVMIPVYDEHRQPISSMCYFEIRQVGTQNKHCSVVFCSFCTQIRLPLVQNDVHKQQMSNVKNYS